MTVKKAKKTLPHNSTQRYLPFSEIRDNMIIMKDWSARMVLKCSTINFLLKSSQEQDAIIMSYQRFLNSLDFPIQILIKSTKLDIDAYLWKLSVKAAKQENTLLQRQTYEYIDYLKKLVEIAQIMKKDFYIVVPFDFSQDKSVRDVSFVWNFKKFWANINGEWNLMKTKAHLQMVDKLKKWVLWRVNGVKTSLESIWIKAKELEKKELVELMFDHYNPSLIWNDKLSEVNSYDLI